MSPSVPATEPKAVPLPASIPPLSYTPALENFCKNTSFQSFKLKKKYRFPDYNQDVRGGVWHCYSRSPSMWLGWWWWWWSQSWNFQGSFFIQKVGKRERGGLEEKAHPMKPAKNRKNTDGYDSDQPWLVRLIDLLFLLWQPNSETKLRHNQVASHQVRAAAEDR